MTYQYFISYFKDNTFANTKVETPVRPEEDFERFIKIATRQTGGTILFYKRI